MKTLIRFISLCLFFTAQITLAAEPNIQVKMRNSGYTMGDFIEMQVEITLPKNQTIYLDSLPLEGRVKPWLDLRSLETKIHQNKIRLDFTWQIFATVEIAQMLKLPEITLKTLAQSKTEKPTNIVIPAQPFHYSPVFSYPLGEVSRYPNLPPLRFDEKTPLIDAAILAGLALSCAFFWLFLQDLLPWLPRNPGPITLLTRQLKRDKSNKAAQLNPQNLRKIHTALNASAGVTLYPQTIDSLFEKAPYLKPHEMVIKQFFHASWSRFYDAQSTAEIDSKKVLSWLKQAAISESLYRRASINKKISSKKWLSRDHQPHQQSRQQQAI
jgi:mxaA protein